MRKFKPEDGMWMNLLVDMERIFNDKYNPLFELKVIINDFKEVYDITKFYDEKDWEYCSNENPIEAWIHIAILHHPEKMIYMWAFDELETAYTTIRTEYFDTRGMRLYLEETMTAI